MEENYNSTSPLTFSDFLEKMKDPAATDLVKAIKSFITSFKNSGGDAEAAGTRVRQFLAASDASFKGHPLWAGSNEAALDAAGEGLEKYIMTKLYDKVFRASEEDREGDEILAMHMRALEFLRPEHLDIPNYFRNDAQWTLAQKELQKINSYKAPRDKLICILNCCRVITNLLNTRGSGPSGADDFFPVLVYIVIRTNPPNLKSNLEYIRRFRAESRLVSEAEYLYTNMVSAAQFVELINPERLSIDKDVFLAHMIAAGVPMGHLQNGGAAEQQSPHGNGAPAASSPMHHPATGTYKTAAPARDPGSPIPVMSSPGAAARPRMVPGVVADLPDLVVKRSSRELEEEGAALVAEGAARGELSNHLFLHSQAGDLTIPDVEALLAEYKELVLKYEPLRRAVDAQQPVDPAALLILKPAEPEAAPLESRSHERPQEAAAVAIEAQAPEAPVQGPSAEQCDAPEGEGQPPVGLGIVESPGEEEVSSQDTADAAGLVEDLGDGQTEAGEQEKHEELSPVGATSNEGPPQSDEGAVSCGTTDDLLGLAAPVAAEEAFMSEMPAAASAGAAASAPSLAAAVKGEGLGSAEDSGSDLMGDASAAELLGDSSFPPSGSPPAPSALDAAPEAPSGADPEAVAEAAAQDGEDLLLGPVADATPAKEVEGEPAEGVALEPQVDNTGNQTAPPPVTQSAVESLI